MENKNEIRMEIKIKNRMLYDLIYKNEKDVLIFSKKLNIPIGTIYNFLNLRTSPYSTLNAKLKPTAQKICDYFKVSPKDLFPTDLYNIKTNKIILEIGLTQIPYNERLKIDMIPEKKYFNEELKDEINKALSGLTEKEAIVINNVYFKNINKADTARILQTSRQAVDIIEERALKKLNHSCNKETLIQYMREVN